MQETVILEAPSAEKGVEGMHGLFTGYWRRIWAVYIGSALWRGTWICPFC